MRFHANLKDASGQTRRLTAIAEEIWHSSPAGAIAEILDRDGPMSLGGLMDAIDADVRRNPGAYPEPVGTPDILAALGDLLKLDLITIRRTGQEAESTPRVRLGPSVAHEHLHPLALAVANTLEGAPASGIPFDKLTRAVQDRRPGNRRMGAIDVLNGLGWLLAEGAGTLDRAQHARAA